MCSYIILYMVVMGKRKITKEKFISIFCLSALEKRYCERDGHGQGSAPGARGAVRPCIPNLRGSGCLKRALLGQFRTRQPWGCRQIWWGQQTQTEVFSIASFSLKLAVLRGSQRMHNFVCREKEKKLIPSILCKLQMLSNVGRVVRLRRWRIAVVAHIQES